MYDTKVSFIKTLSGLSLIEILISIAGSLIVLSLLLTCYSHLNHHLLKQHAFTVIQHNADSTLKLLTREIHLAGLVGCAKLSDHFLIKSHALYDLTANNKLNAYLGVNNQHGFTARYLDPKYNELLTKMENAYEITITSKSSFGVNDILLISNCRRADIFEVDKVVNLSPGAQKIISRQPLSHLYEKNSAMGFFQVNSYFVANTNRKNSRGKSIYALYRRTIKGQQMELIENIDSLLIRYALNNNGRIIELESSQMNDWSKVVGVSLCIRLSHGTQQQPWCSYAALQQS